MHKLPKQMDANSMGGNKSTVAIEEKLEVISERLGNTEVQLSILEDATTADKAKPTVPMFQLNQMCQ